MLRSRTTTPSTTTSCSTPTRAAPTCCESIAPGGRGRSPRPSTTRPATTTGSSRRSSTSTPLTSSASWCWSRRRFAGSTPDHCRSHDLSHRARVGEDDRVRSRRVAVAATGQQALAAGLGVAEDGGNAVDAALASAFVTLATEPGIVSLGGGAYVAVWPAEGDPVVVDGNVEMPGRGGDASRVGRGLRELVTDYGGGVTMSVGAGSVATPGVVPAFATAADRYAVLPWARLVAPAVEAARTYPLGAAAARYLGHVADQLFAEDDEARGLVSGPDGSAPRAGQRCTNELLAGTLVRLAEQGPGLFADGEVGRALVAVMSEQGGLITSDDLAAYEPVVRPAHRLTVGDWEIATNPPPSVGGPMLAVMLAELARRTDWTWDDAIEIQRRVLGYRTAVHDLSPDLEADGLDLLSRIGRHGLSALRGSSSTAHVSAVDSDGNACAVTMSSGYSAGMCIPDTGILLNNTLGEVELNRLGLHALRPGTRLASNMAPTTARTRGTASGEHRPLAI